MPRSCSICTNPKRSEIDAALVAGTAYRHIASTFGLSSSATYRHKNKCIPRVMADAVQARKERDLEHGDDFLGQLLHLHERATAILTRAEDSGELRAAIAAIRKVRGCLEFGSKLTGQIAEQHLHLHGHTMLSPEAAQQFIEAMATMREVVGKSPHFPHPLGCLLNSDPRPRQHGLESGQLIGNATEVVGDTGFEPATSTV